MPELACHTDKMRVIANDNGDASILTTIEGAYNASGGSVSGTARRLEVSRNTLERWIRDLDIQFTHALRR